MDVSYLSIQSFSDIDWGCWGAGELGFLIRSISGGRRLWDGERGRGPYCRFWIRMKESTILDCGRSCALAGWEVVRESWLRLSRRR